MNPQAFNLRAQFADGVGVSRLIVHRHAECFGRVQTCSNINNKRLSHSNLQPAHSGTADFKSPTQQQKEWCKKMGGKATQTK